jgi:hypothetical protein
VPKACSTISRWAECPRFLNEFSPSYEAKETSSDRFRPSIPPLHIYTPGSTDLNRSRAGIRLLMQVTTGVRSELSGTSLGTVIVHSSTGPIVVEWALSTNRLIPTKRPRREPQATFLFDVRYMRKGQHSVMLLLPEAYHAPIGLVIAYWGNFEVAFDACLAALISGESADGGTRDTSNWNRRRFKRRSSLFKKICSEWLSTWKAVEAKKLATIADRAGDLHWRRNMIAHGVYSYTIPPYSSVATNCRAINHESGDEMPFDEHVLKKLYHDISHLTAELIMTLKTFCSVEGPFLALPDTEVLRVYRETNHP